MPPIVERLIAIPFILAVFATLAFSSQANSQEPVLGYQFGFDHKIKLGSWSPVTFEIPNDCAPVRFEITAPDGNGIPVTSSGVPTIRTFDNKKIARAWGNVGRGTGNILCELLDAEGEILHSQEIEIGQNGVLSVLDSTVPMILTIEKDDALASVIESVETQLFATDCEVIPINNAISLPENPLAYQGVQVVYITTTDTHLINSISDRQFDALETWAKNGGKIVFCVGKNAKHVLGNDRPLARFVPGKFLDTFEIESSSQFELYTMSKDPLLGREDAPIVGARIEEPDGIVELSISKNPIIVRRDMGFGQLVFSAVDVHSSPMSDWVGQKSYLMRLTFGQINLNRSRIGESESRGIVQYGYQDIMGQLVFPLEKFSKVQFINFTIVALLIALFILCIGPGDFFFLRNVVGKMEWTWLTFTLLALGFSGLAYFLSTRTKPTNIQINQLEIIDFDSSENLVRGNIWTNIYSPSNTKCDIASTDTNSLGLNTKSTVVTWMGLPGPGLGGMKSKTTAGLMLQGYGCDFKSNSGDRSELASLPVKVSSTKSVHSKYSTTHDFSIRSRLRLNPTTNQLQGTVTNPFDEELRGCRLVFENWAYVLDRPLAPQESVDVFTGMKERTSSSYFSRRAKTADSKGGSKPWNPQESNIDRIAELMMFFNAANGRQYTGMTHGFQPYVDMSEHLNLRRAVLFGKLEGPTTKLNIDSDMGPPEYDQCRTFVRLVLPVQYKK